MTLIGELTSLDHLALAFHESVAAAARKMRETARGEVIVVDHAGRAVGMLTACDIVVRVIGDGRDPTETSVGQVCTDPLATVGPDDDVNHARRLMMAERISRLPVVDDNGKPLGILTMAEMAEAKPVRDNQYRALARSNAGPRSPLAMARR